MKKIIAIYGGILGFILCVNMFYMVNLCYSNPDFKSNDVLGYAFMVLVFSLIFFGVRNYRNSILEGKISFGKALKTGLIIALVASVIYVVVWLFYYYLFVPDYLDHYINHVIRQTPAEKLSAVQVQMEDLRKMYQTPGSVALVTFLEVFPVGLIVALISAAVLRKKMV